MKSIYGLDIASAHVDVGDGSGLRRKKFQNIPKGFAKLRAWSPDAELYVMEATGSHHVALADYLYAQGVPVAVINPARAKHYAASLGIRNKTDQMDAQVLAQFAAANELPLYQPLPAWQKELRALVRSRESLVNHMASLKVRRQEPELLGFVKGQLEEAIAFAQEQLKNVHRRIRGLFGQDAELAKKLALLRTIPGVGEVLAWTLLAELGWLGQFASAKQAAAFVGVCPCQRSSGTMRWMTRMSKAGNAYMRKALYMPALAAMRVDGPFRALALRLI